MVLSPFWEVYGLFLETSVPFHTKLDCTKFGWNWSSGSDEDGFLAFSL